MREGPAGRIFISYRREDTPHVAGRLFDRLEMRFGAGNIFMDVDSIEPGMDFAEAIEDAVGACDVLLVLIGPHWVDAIDENGRRRLADPDDFVALEITAALRRQIRVVPVLVDGVSQLRRRELPETLATLARRQSVRLDHTSFAAGVAALVIALERALRERAADLDDRPEPETIELEPGHERSSALTKRIGVAPGDAVDGEHVVSDTDGTVGPGASGPAADGSDATGNQVPVAGQADDISQTPTATIELSNPSTSLDAEDDSSGADTLPMASPSAESTRVGAPADPTPSDASQAAHDVQPPTPPMPAPPTPFPAEHQYRQVVESQPARPSAPPETPTRQPPGPNAARRRRISIGIGALIFTLALIGAALVWANLPKPGTEPLPPTTTVPVPVPVPPIEHTLTGHTNWVFGVTTAQLDGRTVVISGSADNTMRVWDLATGTPVGSPFTGHTGPVSSVATAPLDGRPVVISGSWDKTVRVWDLATGTQIGSPFIGHTGPVFAVATAQLDGRTVVISGSVDKTVRVWDLATGTPVGSPFTGHKAAVAAVTTAQLDGRTVVISGSNDNTVRVWDLATGKPIGSPFTGHTGYVQAVTTAQLDGRTVVISGGDDNAVRVWDLTTRAPVGAPFTGHTKRVVAVTTAQLRGRTVVISGGWDNTVQVWDLATRAPAGSPFTDHTDFVCAVATAQSGERTAVISGGRDNTVRVWDLDARMPP